MYKNKAVWNEHKILWPYVIRLSKHLKDIINELERWFSPNKWMLWSGLLLRCLNIMSIHTKIRFSWLYFRSLAHPDGLIFMKNNIWDNRLMVCLLSWKRTMLRALWSTTTVLSDWNFGIGRVVSMMERIGIFRVLLFSGFHSMYQHASFLVVHFLIYPFHIFTTHC